MKIYRKKQYQPMEEWHEGYDMTNVIVSQADKYNGSPKIGDMIATNPINTNDKWLVAHQFFIDNYEEVTL